MRLIAQSLACARGGFLLFDGVSFDLGPGDCLLARGPNGSGKTTLLRALAGFLSPQAGSVRLEGAGAGSLTEHCHFIGHLNGVKQALSAGENLAFWRDYFEGAEADACARAATAFRLDLLLHLPAAYLSAGQKRRLALARLLVARRPLWLLDEPSTSLDAASTGLLESALAAHLAEGGIAVVATHAPLAVAGARDIVLGGAGT